MRLPLEQWIEYLAETEEQMRQFVEQLDAVLWIADPATQENFYRSTGLQGLMEVEEGAAISADDWLAVVHPEDRDRVRKARMHETRRVPLPLEYRLLTKTGEVRWVRDRSFELVGRSDGRNRWILIAQEVTADKQTQLELERRNCELEERLASVEIDLQQTRARLQSIEQMMLDPPAQKQIENLVHHLLMSIESVNEGITVSDFEGNFAIYNSKMVEITGYSGEEANNATNFLELLYPDPKERQRAIGGIETVSYGGRCRDIETTIRAKDGTNKTLLVSSSAIDYLGKKWLLSAYRDISDRKRAEQALKLLAEREGSLRTIAYRLKQTHKIAELLNITVEGARNFLRADRALIYRFEPNGSGNVIVESSAGGLPSVQSWHWFDERQNNLQYFDAWDFGKLDGVASSVLESLHILSQLVVPIPSEPRAEERALWGILVVHQCSHSREWQPLELRFLSQLAAQLGAAIDQAERYNQLQAANQLLEIQVAIDSLTQVANRRKFDEYLLQEWKRLARQQQPLSLMICDVDFFKAYNDTYGHLQGDRCLQQVARCLHENVRRSTDLVARYGGEEFAIVLPNTPLLGALYLSGTINEQIRLLNLPHSASLASDRITLSLGVATTIPDPTLEPEILIAAADRALYRAKTLGRDRAVSEDVNSGG
ncbi:diguanylate cyclase [Oscillatoria sp. FACHB-1406]|uniref:sensor domain-containing diguanylate cyclase n=1 Tax=Oscillatoria sp. FACHB-1406 TaxID=2692846 RepID=UPI00168604AB|nr:diguanylate cyclase [Oscillatoria sp. FACHB-1406]MBD2580031.1 diguanylate cyclase [Oscillatoria sp. FACHB-1406]